MTVFANCNKLQLNLVTPLHLYTQRETHACSLSSFTIPSKTSSVLSQILQIASCTFSLSTTALLPSLCIPVQRRGVFSHVPLLHTPNTPFFFKHPIILHALPSVTPIPTLPSYYCFCKLFYGSKLLSYIPPVSFLGVAYTLMQLQPALCQLEFKQLLDAVW